MSMTFNIVGQIINRYIPPRMINQRRKMNQELQMVINNTERVTHWTLVHSLKSQPLWKRIWTAITKDY